MIKNSLTREAGSAGLQYRGSVPAAPPRPTVTAPSAGWDDSGSLALPVAWGGTLGRAGLERNKQEILQTTERGIAER